jgi:hypothetical protein
MSRRRPTDAPLSLDDFLEPPPLSRASLAPSSFKQYQSAVRAFMTHTRLSPDILLSLPTATIDRILCDYINLRFAQTGGLSGRSPMQMLRCGLAFFVPRLVRRLKGAKRLLDGWGRAHPSVPAPPLPWPICVLLACTLLHRRQARSAIATLIMFHCYLRVSEMVNLRVGDVRVPRHALAAAVNRHERPYDNVQVHLRKTKTRDNQTVVVTNRTLALLLHRCIFGRAAHELVFDFASTNEYRYGVLKPLLRDLGLQAYQFRPHSFRHGGATHDYAQGRHSASFIQRRGRWAASKSRDHYIQTLQAVDISETLPSELYRLGCEFEASLEPFFMATLDRHKLLPSVPSDFFYVRH